MIQLEFWYQNIIWRWSIIFTIYILVLNIDEPGRDLKQDKLVPMGEGAPNNAIVYNIKYQYYELSMLHVLWQLLIYKFCHKDTFDIRAWNTDRQVWALWRSCQMKLVNLEKNTSPWYSSHFYGIPPPGTYAFYK